MQGIDCAGVGRPATKTRCDRLWKLDSAKTIQSQEGDTGSRGPRFSDQSRPPRGGDCDLNKGWEVAAQDLREEQVGKRIWASAEFLGQECACCVLNGRKAGAE